MMVTGFLADSVTRKNKVGEECKEGKLRGNKNGGRKQSAKEEVAQEIAPSWRGFIRHLQSKPRGSIGSKPSNFIKKEIFSF